MSTLVCFYFGLGPDEYGRTLASIQDSDHASLERMHDYIQWLFPLPRPSRCSGSAPILTSEDIEWFRTSRLLRRKLLGSFELMLDHLGFELTEEDGTPRVSCRTGLAAPEMSWLTPENHNLPRITRMLKSLTLLGLRDYADAFLRCLEELYEGDAKSMIRPATMRSWRDATGSH